MKKIIKTLVYLCFIFNTTICFSQIVVKERPVKSSEPILKSTAPSAEHLWIEEGWKWDKKTHQYVWIQGYWALPKLGEIWIEGKWI